MPITINVGLTKKVGRANYGSVGASCNVSFEASHDQLENDPAGFHANFASQPLAHVREPRTLICLENATAGS
jgi:hypothetical protein